MDMVPKRKLTNKPQSSRSQKIKFTLVQTMKAQRGSRGTALLYL
jgi:hypothetical protein